MGVVALFATLLAALPTFLSAPIAAPESAADPYLCGVSYLT